MKDKMRVATATQKTYSPSELAKTFDQSLLRPEKSSTDQIKKAAKDAREFGFRSLVVHPCKVSITKSLLQGTDTLTVAVSDFPHGRGLTKVRVEEVKELFKIGTDEVDIVSRYERLLEGDYKGFEEDLKAVTKATGGNVLKIILEIDLLKEEHIRDATRIIAKIAKEDKGTKLIVKTKTGFTDYIFPNLEAVKIIRKALEETNQYAKTVDELGNGKVGIKASGGIKTKEDAIELLEAGAHILGTSSGEKLAS